MRQLDGITDSMDINLSKVWEIMKGRKPGVLQIMGSQRVGHDLATEQQQQRTKLAWLLETEKMLTGSGHSSKERHSNEGLGQAKAQSQESMAYISEIVHNTVQLEKKDEQRREKKRLKSNVVAGKGGYRGYEMI